MAKKRAVVACVGDSITYGFGLAHRRRDSYPGVLGRLLGKGYRVYNYGLSGRTLLSRGDCPYTKERAYRRSLRRAAAVYLLMLGTNDSKPGNWDPGAFSREWEDFAGSYLTLPHHPAVIGMLPPKAFSVEGNPVVYRIDNDVLRSGVYEGVREAAARLGIPLIDLYALTENHPEWFQDGVHPNALGCREIASRVRRFLGENGWD